MPIATLSYIDTDGQHTIALDSASMSIGRSPGQDVVLRDPVVSRQHATIVREGDTCVVVDRNSTHGTFLNGVRVQRAVLAPGDVLQMGSLRTPRLRFDFEQADQATRGLGHGSFGDLLSSLRELRPPGGELRTAAREMEQLNWLLRAARRLNWTIRSVNCLARHNPIIP